MPTIKHVFFAYNTLVLSLVVGLLQFFVKIMKSDVLSFIAYTNLKMLKNLSKVGHKLQNIACKQINMVGFMWN